MEKTFLTLWSHTVEAYAPLMGFILTPWLRSRTSYIVQIYLICETVILSRSRTFHGTQMTTFCATLTTPPVIGPHLVGRELA
jgi:hypothetical protein